MHQIFADLCPFESFCKLFAAYCLEVIVGKFYFIIGILFANNMWTRGGMEDRALLYYKLTF